jgi:Holliday junction resolvase
MGKASQRKGRNGERELVTELNRLGIPARIGQAVSYGSCPDVVGVPGIHAECKRVEKLNIETAMGQAIRDAEKFKDGAPAVFHRRNRKPWLVTMLLDDWVKIAQCPQREDNTNDAFPPFEC